MNMETLASCPACGSTALDEIWPYNDLRYLGRGGDADAARSDFVLCRRCGLMFAGRRQVIEVFAEYYTRFAEWESRSYAVYPPPDTFVRGKVAAAAEIGHVLAKHGLLRPGMRVLHIRADGGALMAHLRDEYGVSEIYGLDIFETNRRFACEHYGLPNVAPLAHGEFAVPFGAVCFDLIISNHLLTHACRPRDAFAVLRQRLTSDGVIVLYNEQDHGLGFRDGAPFLRDGINNFHKQLFTEDSLLTFLRLAGAAGEVVGHRNWSPLVIARPAPPLSPSELPARDFTRQLQASRSWASRHERRWRWNVARRLRHKYRLVDVTLRGLRRIERRVAAMRRPRGAGGRPPGG